MYRFKLVRYLRKLGNMRNLGNFSTTDRYIKIIYVYTNIACLKK